MEENIADTPRLSRRKFLRRSIGGLGATAAGAFLYTWRLEPHWIEVVQQRLTFADLPTNLVGKRIVQISDIHAGPVVDQSHLLHAAEMVAEIKPDLIVVTGDFMSCRRDESIPKVLEVVKALPVAPLGCFAILGNHDYGQGWRHDSVANKLAAGLERREIRVLRNEATDVAGLQLGGVDELWTNNFDAEKMLGQLQNNRPSIVLCHNPDAVDLPEWKDYRGWFLAGHTHGGQCKPPFLPPPMLPVKNRRYVAGEYDVGPGRTLYINRGLGYLRRVRFNARPEITVLTLARA